MTRVVVAVLVLFGLALRAAPVAAETCGISDTLLKSGFEAGELPGVTLPPSNTPVTLSITSPAAGATVGLSTIQVIGDWTGPPNSGLTVNGQPVLADFTHYASYPITLASGSNTITVTIVTQDGATQTVTRSVTYDPLQAGDIAVSTGSSGDFSPLTVSFNLTTKSGLALGVMRIQADFDGNGSTDLDSTNPATALSYTYTDPGTYDASFVVTLSDNTTRTVVRRVIAVNANQTRYTLCQVYGDMRTRLAAQDVTGALNTLHPSLRPEFQTFWNSLGAGLPAVANSLGQIADGTFSVKTADYLVIEPVAGSPGEFNGFHITFELDENGVWRIVAM